MRYHALFVTTAACALMAGPALAQGTAAAAAGQSGGLEEIVVTAQKREQNLQDVPVAVTALTADTLSNRGINDVVDITRAVPSLTITQTQSPNNSNIILRGIGTNAFSTGVESSVAVVVDDVSLLQQSQAFSGLTDIARVEVLRGPQGTLFGKSASAGVISITSQAPTRDMSAGLNAVATSDEEYRVDGYVSGSVNERIGVRFNAFYSTREGYIRNLATGNKLGGDESYGFRFRGDLEPTDRLTINLIASYSNSSSTPTRTWRYADPSARIFGGGGNPGVLVAPALVGQNVGPENFTVRQNVEGSVDSKQSMLVGKVTLDLGAASLMSITSHQDWKQAAGLDDGDYTDLAVVGRAEGMTSTSPFHARQFAQELRLVSTDKGPFSYLLGLYYANGRTDRYFDRLAVGPLRASWDSEAGTKTYAAFTQLSYDLTSTTHVDAGLRWNREKIHVRFANLLPPATNACYATCIGNAADNRATYKIALRQDIGRDAMLYASYATGYKGQGYDVSTGFTAARAANPVKPEYSKAYELGLKSEFFDRHLQLNVTGFWTDYKNFQAQSAVLVDGTPQFQLSNVGKLRSKGVEVELSAKPAEGLRIDASAAYTDAKIRDFPNANCYVGQTVAQGCVDINPGPAVTMAQENLAGQRLANAPKFKYTVSANYTAPLSGGLDAFVQADWTHQSRVNFDLLGNPATVQQGYGILNGSIGIEESDSKAFRVSLFVNNLLDKAYASLIIQAQGEQQGLATQQFLPRNARRYGGIRARFRY